MLSLNYEKVIIFLLICRFIFMLTVILQQMRMPIETSYPNTNNTLPNIIHDETSLYTEMHPENTSIPCMSSQAWQPQWTQYGPPTPNSVIFPHTPTTPNGGPPTPNFMSYGNTISIFIRHT